MSKTRKNLLSILLIAITLFAVNTIFNLNTVSATVSKNDEFTYSFIDSSKTDIIVTSYLKSNATTITIPSKIDGHKVKKVSGGFLTSNITVKEIIISNGIESLEGYEFGDYDYEHGSFEHCSSLEKVVLPTTLKTIGNRAFYDCSNLKTISIPDSVEYIGEYAFGYTSLEGKIKIGKKVKYLSDSAFYNCKDVTSISVNSDNKNYSSKGGVLFNKGKSQLMFYPPSKGTKEYKIPSTVNVIHSDAFSYAKYLTKVTVPKTVDTIPGAAFFHCENLKSVVLPNKIKIIGSSAFGYCKKLNSINIPDKVYYIGDKAFYHCENLTSITIPDKVTFIRGYTFSGCKKLKNVKLSENLLEIQLYGFSSCSNLKKITIPNSVKTIENGAFYNCKNLKKIKFSKNLKTIGLSNVFAKCKSLETLDIPVGVETFPLHTIQGCDNLKKITLQNPYCKFRRTKAEWKHDDLVISSYDNSKAQTFAKEENLKFESLGTNTKVVKLKSELVEKTNIKLSWKKIDGATSYQIYQSTDGTNWKRVSTVKKTSATISNLKSSQTYYYKVRAVNNNQKYSFSTYISQKTK